MSSDESKHAAEVVRHLAAMARQRREEHAERVAKIQPAPVKGPRDMLRYLAVHKLEPDFAIPARVVDAIAIALAGKDAWSKVLAKLAASNDDRRAQREWRRKRVRAAADRLRAEHPGISDSAIADMLADGKISERTIRDYIKKN